MAKKIDVRVLKFFPELKKSSTWCEAWEYLNETTGIDCGVYAKGTGSKRVVDVSLSKSEETLGSIQLPSDKCFGEGPGEEFDFNYIFKSAIDWLISNKHIKKPRNSKKIQQAKTDELTELRKERDRITMKIWAWKKTGKDTTELERSKTEITKLIKSYK